MSRLPLRLPKSISQAVTSSKVNAGIELPGSCPDACVLMCAGAVAHGRQGWLGGRQDVMM